MAGRLWRYGSLSRLERMHMRIPARVEYVLCTLSSGETAKIIVRQAHQIPSPPFSSKCACPVLRRGPRRDGICACFQRRRLHYFNVL